MLWNEKQMLGMIFWWVTLDGQKYFLAISRFLAWLGISIFSIPPVSSLCHILAPVAPLHLKLWMGNRGVLDFGGKTKLFQPFWVAASAQRCRGLYGAHSQSSRTMDTIQEFICPWGYCIPAAACSCIPASIQNHIQQATGLEDMWGL